MICSLSISISSSSDHPPAEQVSDLIENLIAWVKEAQEVHPLIKSCVFHYEFGFIHPFSDGNGRMGRMWQTLLLYKWKPVFGWLPIEVLIKERQEEYCEVLRECGQKADSSAFIEYILEAIYVTMKELLGTEQVTEQVRWLLDVMGESILSTKELMENVGLKHRPTFRDNYLLSAIELGFVKMTIPEKPNSSKQKYQKK